MAHMVETMMYAGEAPWHGLGTRVPAEVTSGEAIKLAGLDWEVKKVPLYAMSVDGKEALQIEGSYGVQRTSDSKVLSVVGDRYTVIQNTQSFEFFDSIVGEGKAVYHTAGSLWGGRKIWILAKLPGDIEIGKGDGVEKYILLTSSHDGSSKLSGFFTPVRVVCQNTLDMAFQGRKRKAGIEVLHTASAVGRMEEAKKVIQMAHEHYDIFATIARKMADTVYTPLQLAELVKVLFPTATEEKVSKSVEDRRTEVISLFDGGKGHDKIAGTAWAAWNAVVEFVDHSDLRRSRSADNRLGDIWFGTGLDIKNQAFNIIAQQVNLSA